MSDDDPDDLAATGARTRAGRSSSEEVEARVTQVADVASRGELTKAKARAMATWWAISTRTMSGYITEAFRQLGMADTAAEQSERRSNNLLKLDAVYELAIQAGDFKAAVAALREANNLGGLVKTRVEHTGANGSPLFPGKKSIDQMTDEELTAFLESGEAPNAPN
jgi:hypothetical protein